MQRPAHAMTAEQFAYHALFSYHGWWMAARIATQRRRPRHRGSMRALTALLAVQSRSR